MVETITPAVHGGRRSLFWRDVALHTLGATLSAGLFGAVLGLLGKLLGAPWGDAGLVALAVIAGVYLLREAFGLPVPLFDRKRQVPEWWRTFYSPPTAAFLYGVGLGIGFMTFLSYGTFPVAATAALASGDPFVGAVICGMFGAARGLSIAVFAQDDSLVLRPVDDAERKTGALLRAANITALAATTCVLLISLV